MIGFEAGQARHQNYDAQTDPPAGSTPARAWLRIGARFAHRAAARVRLAWEPSGGKITTAAERSGRKCGSGFSRRNTATKFLMGLPSAPVATGLASSKCAGNIKSG